MNNRDNNALPELLPCPFCGGTNTFVEPDETGSGGQWVAPIHVGCAKCCFALHEDDLDDAIAAWNRRAEPSSNPLQFGEMPELPDFLGMSVREIEEACIKYARAYGELCRASAGREAVDGDCRAVWPKTVVVASGGMCFTADWDGEYFVTKSPIRLDGRVVFQCKRCPVSVESEWQPPDCPECGDPCELDETAKPSPTAPELPKQGEGEFLLEVMDRLAFAVECDSGPMVSITKADACAIGNYLRALAKKAEGS